MMGIVIGVALAALGAVFSYVLPMAVESLRYRRKVSITGEWHSAWETKNVSNPGWVTELVAIRIRFGHLEFKNRDNSSEYSWSGRAKLVGGSKSILGEWHSNEEGAHSAGTFLLVLSPNGRYMYGYMYGLNDKGEAKTGGFVLARDEETLTFAQKLLYDNRVRLPR